MFSRFTNWRLVNWIFGSAPQTLTDKPWRPNISWTEEFEQGLLSDIKKLDPSEKPNLLMMGPAGQGKSSFINAIISIGKGRKYAMALSEDNSGSGWTSDFDGYTNAELLQGYNLMDSMGIETKDKSGIHPDDIVFSLKGHVKKGYTFNPIKPITEEDMHYWPKPALTDQCHCVIFVVSAIAMHGGIDPLYVQIIKEIQMKIRQEHVPRVLILTKVDLLCDEVKDDITKLFRSVKVMQAITSY